MNGNIFDSNQLMMMINVLNVSTHHLKEEVSELSIQEIEQRWKEMLSAFHDCFAYAQSNGVDLREYKTDLREIVDNLYGIEQLIRARKDGKIFVNDETAQVVSYIAGKIDDILASIGWKRVVQPITEAIFIIPMKIVAMFASKAEAPQLPPVVIQNYLPSPAKPEEGEKETLALQVLRQWKARTSGDEAVEE